VTSNIQFFYSVIWYRTTGKYDITIQYNKC